jgi:opacity protein-like surface antigen
MVALTTATSASAADFKGPAPAAVAPWSWSGFYIGAHAGYGWARDPFNDAIFGNKIPPLLGINANGFLGGFQAGANVQHGPWVGGLEIDLSGTNIKGSTSSTGTVVDNGDSVTTTVRQTDKFDWIGSARARFGYVPWPNLLLYGTGGLAWTRFNQTQQADIVFSSGGTTATITQTISTPTWRFGWVAGAGVETRLWDSNWLARIEYLHFDFRDSGNSISTEFGSSTSDNLTVDVVRAGLSYKFGLGPWAGAASAAYAADMPLKAPRVAGAPWTWSGFYIGGHVGYGWGRDPFNEGSDPFDLHGVNSNGVLGGFQAGINRQSGAWVGGLEVDLTASAIKGSRTVSTLSGEDTVSRRRTDRFEMLGSARARLGYLVWPSVLVYGTGGLAWTRFVQTEENVTATGGVVSFSDTRADPSWRFGWIAGAGVEARLWDTNWLGRIEYLHYDFGQAQPTSFSDGFGTTSGHLTVDVIRAGLSYKLDWLTGSDGSAKTIAMPVKAPPVDIWDWSGYYLGGHVGYGWGHDPRKDEFFGAKAPPTSPVPSDINSNGWIAGFQAGHNWQVRNWVGGLEIDLSASGIKGSQTSVATDGTDTEIEKDTDKFKLLGSARARLGYLVWPNVLFYGTGGLGWTQLVQESTFSDSGGLSGGSSTSWHFGWVAGAGVETRLWNTNWLWRLEYLHYDFGDRGNQAISIVSPTDPTLNSAVNATTGHLTIDAVRTGLSYKFN